jgi:putative spermidine/putrescine transport system permease protein
MTRGFRSGSGVPYLRSLMLALPFLVLFVAFFIVPMALMFSGAFHTIDPVTFAARPGFTIAQFSKFLTSPFYLGIAAETFFTAVLATLVSLVMGFPLALHLSRAPAVERRILWLIVLSPLVVSVVILNFGWLIVLSPQGVINSILLSLNLISTPLDLLFTRGAVVVGLVHVNLPFMVIAIENTLRTIPPEVIRSAESLGSSRFTTFVHVTLPLSIGGVVSGCVIVFALSASAFVTPVLLGGTWVKTMAALAYEQALVNLDIPFAAAVSMILLVSTTVVVILIERIGALFQPKPLRAAKRAGRTTEQPA